MPRVILAQVIGTATKLAALAAAEKPDLAAYMARIGRTLKPKGKETQTGNIDLFIRALGEEEDPFSLFALGPITLPSERHFAGAVALGAMIAHDDIVAEFLGIAENPAHSAWNSNGAMPESW